MTIEKAIFKQKLNERNAMHYEGAIFRPPSEAQSILLQVTIGCSHNRCGFCGSYREKKFRIQDDAIIQEDLRYAAALLSDTKRLFLCDGDALIIPQPRLLGLLETINEIGRAHV
jgi:radical SAM superfamily enzyme YgiQ (UPF0313 family)